jgi:hypothetical protein
VVDELALTQRGARVDIAVVGDEFIGFEIKTANDSLARLPSQLEAYGAVFDRIVLAAETRHVADAVAILPPWWGILELKESSRGPLWIQRRVPKLNPTVDLHALVQLLWRDEVLEELDGLGVGAGLASANKSRLWATLASTCPGLVNRRGLKAIVRNRLRTRAGWRVEQRPELDGGLSSPFSKS